jgi:hypothetical protein
MFLNIMFILGSLVKPPQLVACGQVSASFLQPPSTASVTAPAHLKSGICFSLDIEEYQNALYTMSGKTTGKVPTPKRQK